MMPNVNLLIGKRLQLAEYSIDLDTAKRRLDLVQAQAEQRIIDRMNGSVGANAESRKRCLTIELDRDIKYKRAANLVARLQAGYDRLRADVITREDGRDAEKWELRRRMIQVLETNAFDRELLDSWPKGV